MHKKEVTLHDVLQQSEYIHSIENNTKKQLTVEQESSDFRNDIVKVTKAKQVVIEPVDEKLNHYQYGMNRLYFWVYSIVFLITIYLYIISYDIVGKVQHVNNKSYYYINNRVVEMFKVNDMLLVSGMILVVFLIYIIIQSKKRKIKWLTWQNINLVISMFLIFDVSRLYLDAIDTYSTIEVIVRAAMQDYYDKQWKYKLIELIESDQYRELVHSFYGECTIVIILLLLLQVSMMGYYVYEIFKYKRKVKKITER
ncbi:hypothetical protein [Ligilactobacillus ceti]|nr:hypothetical protein [Ligilactobacillus ceti]